MKNLREDSPAKKAKVETIKADVEKRIGKQDLVGVMMQQVIDDFVAGKIKTGEDVAESLGRSFVNNPFTGEKLATAEVKTTSAKAAEILETLKGLDQTALEQLTSTRESAKEGQENTTDIKKSQVYRDLYQKVETQYKQYDAELADYQKHLDEQGRKYEQKRLRDTRRAMGLPDPPEEK